MLKLNYVALAASLFLLGCPDDHDPATDPGFQAFCEARGSDCWAKCVSDPICPAPNSPRSECYCTGQMCRGSCGDSDAGLSTGHNVSSVITECAP